MDDMVGEMSAGKGWMCTAWLDAPCWAGLVWLVTVAVRCCCCLLRKLRGWRARAFWREREDPVRERNVVSDPACSLNDAKPRSRS